MRRVLERARVVGIHVDADKIGLVAVGTVALGGSLRGQVDNRLVPDGTAMAAARHCLWVMGRRHPFDRGVRN